MERRDLLERAAAFAAWLGLRDSQAAAADTDQPAAALSGEKIGLSLTKLGPVPVEIRKGYMLYRTLGLTGKRVSAFGLSGHDKEI